jgi:hypothetical protein
VAGILRLSTKYDVRYLRHRAISYFANTYPSTLEAWDRRGKIADLENAPFVALKLIREVDIPEQLPAVLYCCSMQSIEDILDGMPLNWRGSRSEMDVADKRTCLIAKRKLEEALRGRVLSFLRVHHVTRCTNRGDSTCNTGRLNFASLMAIRDSDQDPLKKSIDWDKYSNFVCNVCFTFSKESFETARRKLWEELPGFFDLPTWSELLHLKESG